MRDALHPDLRPDFRPDFSSISPLASEDETPRETAPPARQTKRLGRGLVVMRLLSDTRVTLDEMPDTKVRRTLLRKLESLQFVVDCWGAMPPRPEQVSAMLEMLLGLQEAAQVTV